MRFPVVALGAFLFQPSASDSFSHSLSHSHSHSYSFGLMRSSRHSRFAASTLQQLAFATSSSSSRSPLSSFVGATGANSARTAKSTTSTTRISARAFHSCPSSLSSSSSFSTATPSRNSPNSRDSLLSSLSATRGGASTTALALNSAVTGTSEVEPTEMEMTAPQEIFRQDYAPLPHVVDKIDMNFVIQDGKTTVTSQLYVSTNDSIVKGAADMDMILDGDETCVKLMSLSINTKNLVQGTDYELAPGKLIIKASALKLDNSTGNILILTTVVQIVPEENTQLSGLYKSGPMYCSQCEAMGFRRITYYPDRPDNMAIFNQIRIEADKKAYPVLLSNGNLIQEADLEDDATRHYAIWTDPFPKPSYLFCVVAGNLGSIQDEYVTTSGRKVKLEIFSEPENVNKLDYAMQSLKRSMQWDEDVFGLEYDLDLYNIVAVNDFNMGAMENKGLNVFNTAYVLADPKSATDTDYERVEGVIGHEYFHNWTGNRVTCRDWFQLTLKEGLTVFRDQEFSGDMMNSKSVKRIEDVRGLRGRQFNEDNSPMAHPIRPESYISMDNFYTATVYSKGAEVIRMYQTLLTPQGFRKGMDLYFQRHDGQAVTCDDFLAAMADANDVDLTQFSLWYETPGTPTVTYSTSYDDSGTFSLKLSQRSQNEKPLHIPISVGLLDKTTGDEVVPTTVLELKEMEQTFTFSDLKGEVVPSILRDFSAPVKLVPEAKDGSTVSTPDLEDLAFLAARDTDGFNKWEAGQQLYTKLIFEALHSQDEQASKTLTYCLDAFGRTLSDKTNKDYSIQAYALTLPGESTLAEQMEVIDPVGIRKARGSVKKTVARHFQPQLLERYEELTAEMEQDFEFKVDAESTGKRRLRNVCLEYLCSIADTPDEERAAATLAKTQFETASGMTDKMAALGCLVNMKGEGAAAREEALEQFYDDAGGDALVLNKWFSVQALANLPDVLDRVKALTEHPDFTLSNPNRCRSLISAFCMNAAPFHDESGAGYEFLGDVLLKLDEINPQISSRMASSLIQWRRYDESRGALMKAQLERLLKKEGGLSDDLYEVVNRGLK